MIITSILLLLALSCIISILVLYANKTFVVHENPLILQVNSLLPQTQCGQCAYPGCKPYAKAIIEDNAPINRCPPGGQATIEKVAALLNKEVLTLDPEHGEELPPSIVFINEEACIGCTLCIQACPVDAIIGAPKMMHTVLTDRCTGCNLCIAPCPVDCIITLPKPLLGFKREKPDVSVH